jgi:TfoX/Sxy family transcriptional regulator of competence genes
MAFNEELAQRIRDLVDSSPGYTEKKMFGGIGFLIFGNMACGVNQADLIIRVGPDNYQAALSKPAVEVFDLTGRPMTGWIVVKPTGYHRDLDLEEWVRQGLEFALSLPQK